MSIQQIQTHKSHLLVINTNNAINLDRKSPFFLRKSILLDSVRLSNRNTKTNSNANTHTNTQVMTYLGMQSIPQTKSTRLTSSADVCITGTKTNFNTTTNTNTSTNEIKRVMEICFQTISPPEL